MGTLAKHAGAAALTVGTVAAMGAGALAAPPVSSAQCGDAVVWGNGGGQCDGPSNPDGSFERCTTVYVLGIGGTTCYLVPPPPPPPPHRA